MTNRKTIASTNARIDSMESKLDALLRAVTGNVPATISQAPQPIEVPAALTADIPMVAAPISAAPRAVAPAAGRSCCPSCQTPIKRLVRANVVIRDIQGAAQGTIVPPFTGSAFLKSLPAINVQLADGRSGTISGDQLFKLLNSRRPNANGTKARAVSTPGFLRGTSTHPDVTLIGGAILRQESDDELAARVFG